MKRPVFAVLGTAMYEHARASRLTRNSQVEVRVGSRNSTEGQVSQIEAVHGASVVILAVLARAHSSIIHSIGPHLSQGIVIVDISNHTLSAPPPHSATKSNIYFPRR